MGRLRTGVLLFIGVFTLYAYTAYPTVAPRDSADLAVAALTAAPAHSPGYPLYALMGKAWLSGMPWGDPAYRLNLMSAAAGAGCAAAVFLLLARSCGLWAGLGAALALALSAPLWKFSLLCEMYSLQGLFLAVLLLLAPGPGQDERSLLRRAALSALLLGLALVNHQAFVLALPGMAALWWGELTRTSQRRILTWPCLALFALGVALYVFLWVRTGDLSRAWAILSRQEYGTWQLSASLSRPLSPDLAGGLLAHFAAGLWRGAGPLTVVLAAIGMVELWRGHRRFAVGLALLFAGFGPGFFLATRFDLGGWVARTVLETAFVAPAAVLCVAAGFGLSWSGRLWKPAAALLAAAAAAVSFWSHAGELTHRDDFCAYDYVKDLRRALPPGSAALAAGDTALYATSYLDLTHGDGLGRRLIHYQDRLTDPRPGFVLGVSLRYVAKLGLAPERGVTPAGLVQSLGPKVGGEAFWDLSVLRPGRALREQESYARDVLLAYAFAHYLSGSLLDSSSARQEPRAAWHFLKAASLDPEDYQIEYNTAR